MDKVGIELQLKSNLEQQLKTIIPLMTKMNREFNSLNDKMVKMAQYQNRLHQGFNQLGQNSGLPKVNNQLANVTNATKTATKHVGMFGQALQGLGKYIAPLTSLVGVYKLLQGGAAIGGAALDYEKTVRRIHMSRFSPAEQQEVIDKSKQFGSSGDYAMTANQFADYALRARAIMPTGRDALDSMSMVGKVDMAMRKIGVEGSDKGDTGFIMAQIFEKLGDRTPQQQQETADLLAKYENYYAGQVPLSTFATQLQRTRGAKLGAEKFGLFGQLFHGISEQLSQGGGGGGQGGVGSGYLALDTLLSGSNMSKQMIDTWREAGMFPGIEQYAKHKKGTGNRRTLIDMPSGRHVLMNGGTMTGAGSDIYSKDVLQN